VATLEAQVRGYYLTISFACIIHITLDCEPHFCYPHVGLNRATLRTFLLQCEELTRRCEHLSAALVDGGRDTQRLREWHAMVSQLESDLAEARAAPQV
jgi:hypothetical protein